MLANILKCHEIFHTTKYLMYVLHLPSENPGNMLQLTGKMVNGKAVQLEALRHHNNKRVSEGLVSFKLNNTHLLHSHVHWMPSSYRQAKVRQKLKDILI